MTWAPIARCGILRRSVNRVRLRHVVPCLFGFTIIATGACTTGTSMPERVSQHSGPLTTTDSGHFYEWGVDYHNEPMNEALIALTNQTARDISVVGWSQVSSGSIRVVAAYLEPSKCGGNGTDGRVPGASNSECTLRSSCPQMGSLGVGSEFGGHQHVVLGHGAVINPGTCAALIVAIQVPASGSGFGVLKGINLTYNYGGRFYVADFSVARSLCRSVEHPDYKAPSHGCESPKIFSDMKRMAINATGAN